MSDQERPSYWAVVPAPVRYDTAIPANAKLLYAELSSLTNEKGYCFASNAYFAANFSMTDTSVRRLLKALADRGFIRIDVVRDKKTNQVKERKIYVGLNPAASVPPSAQNCAEGSEQKSAEGSAQNCSALIMYNNKNNNNKPPIVPQAVEKQFAVYSGGDKQMLEALMGFAENRAAIKKPIKSERSAALLLGKLDRIGKDTEERILMLNTATEHNWQTVYAPKDREAPAARSNAPVREEDEWL